MTNVHGLEDMKLTRKNEKEKVLSTDHPDRLLKYYMQNGHLSHECLLCDRDFRQNGDTKEYAVSLQMLFSSIHGISLISKSRANSHR